MKRMRNVKIVATLGPASDDYEMIRALHEAGADVFRLNMSHGSHEEIAKKHAIIRQVEKDTGSSIAILADLQGPKLRVGVFANEHGEMLGRLVGELGVRDRVAMPGRIAEQDLSRYYAQASLFALATRYEGYGIVFDEATVHGLPIVSCRVGAVPGTVSPEAGLLVPPDDPSSFATALRRVLTEDGLRDSMAAAASKAAHGLASWDSTAQSVAAVLERIGKGSPQG